MKIRYELKRLSDPTVRKETLASCEKGRKGFQSLVVIAAKYSPHPFLAVPLIWILSRFYKRTVTDTSVEYDFPLLSSNTPAMGDSK